MGRHRIQGRGFTIRTAATGAAVSGAALWIALAGAGTATANTHHGPNAPGNPFGGVPQPTRPVSSGVVASSTTSIVRHSTTGTNVFGTTPRTGTTVNRGTNTAGGATTGSHNQGSSGGAAGSSGRAGSSGSAGSSVRAGTAGKPSTPGAGTPRRVSPK
jgi:hypothetical protein